MDSSLRTDNSEKSYTSLASKKTSVTSEKISASVRRKPESSSSSNSDSIKLTSSFMKPAVNTSSNVSVPRRNSTGGLLEKRAATTLRKAENGVGVNGKKIFPVPDTVKKNTNTTEIRRTSLPPSITPKAPVPRLSARSLHGKSVSAENAIEKSLLLSNATSSLKKVASSSDSSTSRSRILRKTPSSISSPRTPSGTSSFKSGSLSASINNGSLLSSRKKSSTPDSREARFMMLPHVEIKAGDDLRLDLRGHRVRSLSASGLNLSPNLEFVYLRDNLLSSVEGIEILKRVKVLDLSFNDFKGPGFEPLENCKALQQLYLAGNKITSLASLPQLPNLEFLSVARNRLKSLSMASQPRLQVLAASKNKISTLKGFPHLPVLEHLRLEENPILDMLHLEAASIILVGPTLKKFNDKDLSHKEIEIAKLYPAHTALCIRDGWEFCRPEHAAESTFSFLLKQWEDHFPPECMLEEAFVDLPFEEDACHCHFKFVSMSSESKLTLKYQWYIGEKTPTNFVPIEGAVDEVYWPKHDDIGKFLKAECTPVLEEIEYPSIFALSSSVSQGTGHPKAINLIINGELIEGNTIRGVAEVAWCGGTPGKCVSSWSRRKWNGRPVAIVGAENEEYKLTVDDIDSSLVFMYTPVTQEGIKGEPRNAMTDFVKAAPPSVNDVRILGDAVEGNTIKGFGEYFGGKEGPSKFEWLRESKEIGGHVVVSSGSTDYTLSEEDVGRRMTFVYIPVNFEGHEGEPAFVVTEIVKKAPPTATNLKILGDLREGNKVTVTAIITRGTEGSSRVQWFKTSSSKLIGEFGLESISMPKIAKAFRIPLGAVGYYIVAKLTPMSPDGETGEPAYVISEEIIDTLPPSLNFLSVTGDYCEGELLTASYGYIGGHEGKSLYDWYIHDVEADEGILILEASGLLQYRIAKDAIGKFVSFKCTPVREDGSIGEPRISFAQERVRPGSPRLLSLRILGNCVEGTKLIAEKRYWGGEEGNSIYRWFLTSPDGEQKAKEGATTSSYDLSYDDIGLHISVSCEPIRSDWARGPIMVSESIGPILPGLPNCQKLDILGSMVEGGQLSFKAVYTGGEKGDCIHEWFRIKSDSVKEKLTNEEFLDLTLEDVDSCIELLFTPVRNDGVRGQPKREISDSIVPADPKGIKLVIPSCTQDNEIVLLKSYYGGKEGSGEYVWYRLQEKLSDSRLQHIAASDAIVVGKTLNYVPSLDDVDSYLAVYWVPTRADGKCGDPLIAISNDPVIAGHPVVSDVCIKELGSGVFVGEGKYYGGHEGPSLYSWYRETREGTIIIDGATSTTYQATDSDYSYRLLFGYTPIRSDSVLGELKISEPSNIVLPDKLEFESFTFNGKEMEGEILHATKIIPESEVQQRIWSRYRKELEYQWFYSVGSGPNQYFEPFPSQSSSSYKIRFEDIGRCLKCDCTVTDVFGRSTGPIAAVTSHILPGIPKIRKLEIEGRGFHTNLYALRGEYSGGREGKSKIQWLRAMVGSPDLISIPGETGRMYEANVDDVGYRIVALYTPIREDGVEGEPTTASTDLIAVEPEIYREVKQKLDLGAVKFEVLCDKYPPLKKGSEVGILERRILEINRKRIKVVKPGSKTSFPTTEIRGTYAPPFHVELYRTDQHRFKIVVDSENEVDLMVQTRHTRDVIILAIRGFAQRFNSTSLNSLLKIET